MYSGIRAKSRHTRVYVLLEVGTVVLAVVLYFAFYRPKEKLEAEWNDAFNRGQVALDKENFIEAQRDFESLLEFSDKHSMGALDIATSQDRLADADIGLEDYQDAVRLDEQALPVFEKYQSLWEGQYAGFLAKLAGSYYKVGRYGEAEAVYKRALALQEKTFGPDALQAVPTLNALVSFYYEREENEIGEPFAKRSIAICTSRLGPSDPCTASGISMLSLVYDGEGRFAEAEGLAREALLVLEASYGAQSYEVASTLNRLGLALEGLGRLRDAETAFSRALSIRQQRSGAQAEGLVPILNNLSRVYSEEGRKRDAAAFLRRAEDISAIHSEGQKPTAQTPVNKGLWDVNVHSEVKASSPAVAAAIKKNGLNKTFDPLNGRVHTCMLEDNWREKKAQLATAPTGCVFTRPFSEDAHGMSSRMRCEGGAMLAVVDSKLSWVNRKEMRLTQRTVVTFRGVAGESVATTEITSIFLSPDCGSVAPGASVPVK
jgi:tetratricopeptide (TPR) repeat protein